MYFAAVGGSIKIMRFLFEQGLDINLKDSTDWTPLMCALTFIARKTTRLLADTLNAAYFLLPYGVDVSIKTNEGCTPLYILIFYYDLNASGTMVDFAVNLIAYSIDFEVRASIGYLSPSAKMFAIINFPQGEAITGISIRKDETVFKLVLTAIYGVIERSVVNVAKGLLE